MKFGPPEPKKQLVSFPDRKSPNEYSMLIKNYFYMKTHVYFARD